MAIIEEKVIEKSVEEVGRAVSGVVVLTIIDGIPGDELAASSSIVKLFDYLHFY